MQVIFGYLPTNLTPNCKSKNMIFTSLTTKNTVVIRSLSTGEIVIDLQYKLSMFHNLKDKTFALLTIKDRFILKGYQSGWSKLKIFRLRKDFVYLTLHLKASKNYIRSLGIFRLNLR